MRRRDFVSGGAGALGLTLIGRNARGGQASPGAGSGIRITLSGVFVGDQAKALAFYTEVLGFEKKEDEPVGQFRWLTVVSPEDPDGTELLLEPNDNAAASTFQKAIFDQGIPATAFAVDDIQPVYERLKGRGVVFQREPTLVGTTTIAVFDDTCGNLIQLYQVEQM